MVGRKRNQSLAAVVRRPGILSAVPPPPLAPAVAFVPEAPPPEPEPEPAPPASPFKVGRLYRVWGGAARVVHADGRDSYHSAGTLLRFTVSPAAVDGSVVEEYGAEDTRRLEAVGLRGGPPFGYGPEDGVQVVSGAALGLARYELARRAEQELKMLRSYQDKMLRPTEDK